MDVTLEIRYFAAAQAAAGTASERFDCSSTDRISDLLGALENAHPGLGAVLPRCSVLLDAVAVAVTTDRQVGSASTVDVLPPFAGG
ncbi:MoaD/ThiS family protein [Williamsia herbipolensis]|uniref:MoaD/ThiS family protein n=1 Tax=Williamsia herbipolensis TaxID=1603258 RepID=A0AAU4K0M9_9NOCA|nr:MoaD/ThiS family protein [Williamsia herbipolensis]